MKKVSPELFDELRKTASNIAVGWLIERKDGKKFGFTSSDVGFTYEGVDYEPTNSFSGSAAVSKNNLSVDNMSAIALVSEHITKNDLMGGRWDNALVRLFWIRPDKPEWGTVPIRGGRLGEIKCRGDVFETELRSVMQKLQQPFGKFYTLECRADFGDHECKVKLDVPEWAPNAVYVAKIAGEAGIGDIVKPTVPNGFWYELVDGPSTVASDVEQNQVAADLWQKLVAIRERNGIR